MPHQLRSSDFKTITACVFIAVLSLIIALMYFTRAFPEASIEFQVNREESLPIAKRFLEGRGIRVEDYRHVSVFRHDASAKVFLERTLGLERMTELTRGPVHLWRWTHRWFKHRQQEEYTVSVTPAGQVAGFSHTIPEAAPGATLDRLSARAIAEKFLVESTQRELTELEFVEARDYRRPARADHEFVWKQRSVDLGDGQWRIQVDVAGDRVRGYHEYVKIPDQWTREYSRLRSRNEAAQQVAEVLLAVMTLGMLVILVRRLRDRDVPLRLSFALGAAGGVLYFLGQLNNFPTAEFGYLTTDSYSSFLGNYVRTSVLAALGVATWIFFLTASAEPVYRAAYPRLTSLRSGFSWRGLRSRSFFINNVVGITLTCFFFAYQTVFYLAANKLGAWSPSEVNYSDMLSTRIPWVWVLFIGFLPAVSEELQFRAFAIPFTHQLLRRKVYAVVLPAFIWGFLHSNYPGQPFFIRGIEVGLGGIIVGLVMLRFGLFGVLIWHYSVDAIYTAFLLLRSSDPYLMISGAITAGIMLLPLVVSLIAYLRTGTFSDDSTLTNESAGVVRASRTSRAAEPALPHVYRPLCRSRWILGLVLIAIFSAFAFLPAGTIGEGIDVVTTRRDAIRLSDQALRKKGLDPASYRKVAWPTVTVTYAAAKYIQERRTIAETDRILRQAKSMLVWSVRYFRPLEKDEHWVYVDASGPRVVSYGRVVDEEAPGAFLTLEEAQKRAEEFLAAQGYRAEDFTLEEKRDSRRKARVDWTFEWQIKPSGSGEALTVDDAHFRIRVSMAGDQVIGFSRFFKLPEQWERERSATYLANTLLTACSSLLVLLLSGVVLALLVRQIRQGAIRWGPAAKVACVATTLLVLSQLNDSTLILQSYDTSRSMSNFWFSILSARFIGVLGQGLGIWLLIAFATSLYPDCWRVFHASARRTWRNDALLAIAVFAVFSLGFGRLESIYFSWFHALAPVRVRIETDFLGSAMPGLGVLSEGLVMGLTLSAFLAVAIYLVELGLNRKAWWLWVAAGLLFITLGPAGAHSWGEFLVPWVANAARLVLTTAVFVLFFRNNIAAYLGSAFCFIALEPMISLLGAPAGFYFWNGGLLAVLSLAAFACFFWGGKGEEGADQPFPASQP